MNRDVMRARELLADGACEDAENLGRIAKGEAAGDVERLVERIARAVRMLERVPAEVID